MEQKDIFSGLSVEKILADVKEMEGGSPMKLWSLEDVDALLSEEKEEIKGSEALEAASELSTPRNDSEKASVPEAETPVLSESVKHAAKVLERLRTLESEENADKKAEEENTEQMSEPVLLPDEPLLSGVTAQQEEEQPAGEEQEEAGASRRQSRQEGPAAAALHRQDAAAEPAQHTGHDGQLRPGGLCGEHSGGGSLHCSAGPRR